MTRYYVTKDGNILLSAATKKEALNWVRMYQEEEKKTGHWLLAEFSILTVTEEEYIKYKK